MNPVAAILGTGASGAPQSTQGKTHVEAAPGFSPLLERALRHPGPSGPEPKAPQRIEGDETHGAIGAQQRSRRPDAAGANGGAHASERAIEAHEAHDDNASEVAKTVRARTGGPFAGLSRMEGDNTAATDEAGTESAVDAAGGGDEAVSALAIRHGSTMDANAAAALSKVERSPEKLEPGFRTRLDRVLQRMESELGYEVRVTETFRTQERQDALYAQGRTAPGPTVTWTRSSNHSRGLAADIVIEGGDDAAYAKLAKVAAEEGLRTLGPGDPGHIELASSSARVGSSQGAGQTRSAATGLVAGVAAPASVATVARTAQVARVAVPGAAIAAPHPDGHRPGTNVRDAVLAATPAGDASSQTGRTGEVVRNAALANAGIHSTGQGRTDALRSSVGHATLTGSEPNAMASAGNGASPDGDGRGSAGAQPRTDTSPAATMAAASAATVNGPVRPVHARETRQSVRAAAAGGNGPLGPALTSEEAGTRGMPATRTVRAAASSPETETDRPRRAVNANAGQTGAGSNAGVFSGSGDADPLADVRAALPGNTTGSTGLANAAEAVAGAGGPDIASRVARLLALQDAQRAAPATGVTLEVGPDDGLTAARIRLGVRGGAIDALIDVADPAIANRLGGRVDELRRALERTGLEPATVLVRELGAGVSAGRGGSASQNQTDPETGRQGWMRRDPGNPGEQRHGRRNSKESQR